MSATTIEIGPGLSPLLRRRGPIRRSLLEPFREPSQQGPTDGEV